MQYQDDPMRFSGTTDRQTARQTDVRGDSNTPSGETPRGKNSRDRVKRDFHTSVIVNNSEIDFLYQKNLKSLQHFMPMEDFYD